MTENPGLLSRAGVRVLPHRDGFYFGDSRFFFRNLAHQVLGDSSITVLKAWLKVVDEWKPARLPSSVTLSDLFFRNSSIAYITRY